METKNPPLTGSSRKRNKDEVPKKGPLGHRYLLIQGIHLLHVDVSPHPCVEKISPLARLNKKTQPRLVLISLELISGCFFGENSSSEERL